jgi:hypothetical protein
MLEQHVRGLPDHGERKPRPVRDVEQAVFAVRDIARHNRAPGYAVRLQALDYPKEMPAVGGRTVIDYPVERMRAGACDGLRVVTERDALAAHAAGCPAALVVVELSPLDVGRLLLAEGAEVAAR